MNNAEKPFHLSRLLKQNTMPQFHETAMGQKFFSSQLPSLIKSINKLSSAIKTTESKNLIVERAIAYTKEEGAYGTDCDLKNAVEDYLKETPHG